MSKKPPEYMYEITDMIVDVCQRIRGEAFVDCNELSMMLMTIAAEGSFTARVQAGGGPARGLMQMEPPTALDTFRWLKERGYDRRWSALTDIWLRLKTVPFFIPSEEEVSWHLEHNDAFALALGRLHYRMFPEPFPDTVTEQAKYWKRYWHTEAGPKPPFFAVQQWKVCRCSALMTYAWEKYEVMV